MMLLLPVHRCPGGAAAIARFDRTAPRRLCIELREFQ